MKQIKDQQHVLEVLRIATPKLRKAILMNCDDKVIRALCEIVINLLKGHLSVDNVNKRKLNKYKKQFRKLYSVCTKKHFNKRKARKAIVQSGGALPFLIPLLAPLIAKAALGGAVAAGAGALTKKIIGQ